MLKEYKHKDTIWVDVESPTDEEIRRIAETYEIDPEVAEKLRAPSPRAEIISRDKYLYFCLHFPIARNINSGKVDKNDSKFEPVQEVDFVLGKNFLITTSYENIDALHEFSKAFEVDSILDKSGMTKHAGYIFVYMILYLYKSLANQISSLRDRMEWIEKNIFSNREKEMVFEISKLARTILYFEEAVEYHKNILDKIVLSSDKIFEKDFNNFLESVILKYWGIEKMIASSRKRLDTLGSTNDSLLSTKQNEIVKNLTMMAFLTYPLALIAAIFGMNTHFNPILGMTNDFWIVLGIMFLFVLVLFSVFRKKGWW